MSSKRRVEGSKTKAVGSDTPKAKRKRLTGEQDILHDLYQTPVTIDVGADSYPFHTYKELLCKDSSFFKIAFEGSFREGLEQKVSLPDDDVETFKIYQTWLNTTQLRYNFDDGEEPWLRLAKLWIFADKIGSPSLENKTADAIIGTIYGNSGLECASVRAVNFTYANTSVGSPLRVILVDRFLKSQPRAKGRIELEEYPSAFVVSVAQDLLPHVRACPDFASTVWDDYLLPVDYHSECTNECCN